MVLLVSLLGVHFFHRGPGVGQSLALCCCRLSLSLRVGFSYPTGSASKASHLKETWLAGSLSGADTSKRVTGACEGATTQVEAQQHWRLTGRGTPQPGSDSLQTVVVSRNLPVVGGCAQRIKGTPGMKSCSRVCYWRTRVQ
uniref:Secreted protein n=1 Tax=Caulerpa lentillifera TaxID=148947 RepID=A0A2Z2QKK9_9CHLO|nr:hypothetical protein [Caulerpa lentillifera]AST24273.1 hypothetical protein [Caulerpa lentillifera]QKS32236.1 hypothetical protein [Caulerpa lentillifera]